MKLRTFIDRPILACVISVLILMLGLISLFNLPMEQYPDIAPPTVMVSTSYTGANAETVQKKCYRSSGRSHQRCGKHDLHDFYIHQQRLWKHHCLF